MIKDFYGKISKIKYIEYYFLGLIILFGGFLRIYNLGGPSLWVDEAISSLASLMILEKGIPLFDSGFLYSRAIIFHYLQAFFLIFGRTEFLVRLPSVIFGLLTIVLGFYIGRQYDKKAGLITALLLAVFIYEISFSRQGRFYQLFQFLFFLTLFFLYKSRNSKKFVFFSIISFFILINVQIQGLVIAPFMVFYFLYFLKGKNKFFAILPLIPLIYKIVGLTSYVSDSFSVVSYYAINYWAYFSEFSLFFFFSVLGVVFFWKKNRILTALIVFCSLTLLLGVLILELFAFRYIYFFIFALLLYSGVFFSWLIGKFGKIMIVALILFVIVPSNLFFPSFNSINILAPVSNFYDISAPVNDYKNLNLSIVNELRNGSVYVSFTPDYIWNIGVPAGVLYSRQENLLANFNYYNGTEIVDVYSGINVIKNVSEINGTFYLFFDKFSLERFINYGNYSSCGVYYQDFYFIIYKCEN